MGEKARSYKEGRPPRERRNRHGRAVATVGGGANSARTEEPAPPSSRNRPWWGDLRANGGTEMIVPLTWNRQGRPPRERRNPKARAAVAAQDGATSARTEEPPRRRARRACR